MLLSGNRVRFRAGEYRDCKGTVIGTVPRYLKGEIRMVRVKIDGYDDPGGWNGKVVVREEVLELIG